MFERTVYYKWFYKEHDKHIRKRIEEKIDAGESINEKELFDELKLEKPVLLANEIKFCTTGDLIEYTIPLKTYGMNYLPEIIRKKYFYYNAIEYENSIRITLHNNKYSTAILEKTLRKTRGFLSILYKEIEKYNATIPKKIQKHVKFYFYFYNLENKREKERKRTDNELKDDLAKIVEKIEKSNFS